MLSERRDEAVATAFCVKAIGNNGWPDKGFYRKVFGWLKNGLFWTQLCCEGGELLEWSDTDLS